MNKNENKTISDEIGNRYVNWQPGEVIFINAQTGTGKTYFILHHLLEYAAENHIVIFYLVNRKILKDQILEEIGKLPMNFHDFIKVETYQRLESLVKSNFNGYDKDFDLRKIGYVVCDEAHYFFADSNFNTNTIISYKWIRNYFRGKIQIYISATLEYVKAHIKKDRDLLGRHYTPYYEFESEYKDTIKKIDKEELVYGIDNDYSHVRCHILETHNKVLEQIKNNKEKWLIFVDNIKRGNELYRELKNNIYFENELDDDQIVFLKADYKKSDQEFMEYERITKEQRQKARILISTAVMDNGVSLKDLELRNVVLDVDVKDQFLQMLGRKRKDGGELNVYLVKKGKQHFQQRLQFASKIYSKALSYYGEFSTLRYNAYKMVSDADFRTCCQAEWNLIEKNHKKLMDELLGNVEMFSLISSIFCAWNGILFLNPFSLERIKYLVDFYGDMIERCNGDEFASVKEQMSWLGKTDEEIEMVIKESCKNLSDEYRKQLIDSFEKILNEEMDSEQNKTFVKDNKDALLYVIREAQKKEGEEKLKTVYDTVYKGRPLTEAGMDQLKEFCNLKYKLEKPTGKTFKVVKSK